MMDFANTTIYPLTQILFWIAATLAPSDATQILVKGPDLTAAWTQVDSGWSISTDRAVYSIDGTTVKTADSTGKSASADVAGNVKGIKEHDWQKSPSLKLAGGEILAKDGATFVFTRDAGTPDEKRYVIQYRLKSAATAALTITIAADGSLSIQGRTVSLDKLSDELTSLGVKKDRPIVLQAAPTVQFGNVTKVMDALKKADYTAVSIANASNPPEAAKPQTAPGPTWAELLGGKNPRSVLAKESSEMKSILIALTMYSEAYNSEWPKKLTDLPAEYFGGKPIDYAPYLYRRPSKEDLQKNSAEFAVLLLKEQPGLPKVAVVGYADGHVATIEDRQKVEKLFPKEPSPSALEPHRVPKSSGNASAARTDEKP